MEIIHIHKHDPIEVKIAFSGLENLFSNQLLIIQKLNNMSQVLDDLTAKVEAETTVEQSAITLLQTLKTELDAAIASGDTAALQALIDKIGSNTPSLADPITATTPPSSFENGVVIPGCLAVPVKF